MIYLMGGGNHGVSVIASIIAMLNAERVFRL
jgi:hypothetical protein